MVTIELVPHSETNCNGKNLKGANCKKGKLRRKDGEVDPDDEAAYAEDDEEGGSGQFTFKQSN